MNLQTPTWVAVGMLVYAIWACGGAPTDGGMKTTTDPSSEIRKVYCGRHLMDTLTTVCQGNYHTVRPVTISRRSRTTSTHKKYAVTNPLLQSLPQTTPLDGKLRRRRGVYNECCERACTFEVLRTYCGEPSTASSTTSTASTSK
uniref:Insulin like peptide 1 n=1 Tax=Euwallacea interjectus TaxID=321055 RepID=A0AB74UIV6_9CUCU